MGSKVLREAETLYQLDSSLDESQEPASTSNMPHTQGVIACAVPGRLNRNGEARKVRSSARAAEPVPKAPKRILLIVYHDGWSILDARALSAQMADACMRLGWQVSNPHMRSDVLSHRTSVSRTRRRAPGTRGARHRLVWMVGGVSCEPLTFP